MNTRSPGLNWHCLLPPELKFLQLHSHQRVMLGSPSPPFVILFPPKFFPFTLWNIDHPAVNNYSSTLKSGLSHLQGHLPLPTRAQSPAASGKEGVRPSAWPWPQAGPSLSTDNRLRAPPVLWLMLSSTPPATLHYGHPPAPGHSRSSLRPWHCLP